jgi:hypothetical protein
MILESIDVLTAQLKENLLKAEEERQKRAGTSEERSDAGMRCPNLFLDNVPE